MRVGVVRPIETPGRWTLKVCRGCLQNRQMPKGDVWCGQCLYPQPKPPAPEKHLALPGLRAVRLRAGLTQRALGELVWLEPSTIGHYENARSRASEQLAHAIAFVLGVFLEELTEEQEIEVQSGASPTREVS